MTPEDGGIDAAAARSPVVLTPCRAGWREVLDPDGVLRCEPWPESGRRDDCPFGETHLPGTPGCARIGPECPADGWPADLPTDRPIVYVDDEALVGGDGSRERPLRTIGEAQMWTPRGGVIAVRTGRYDEAFSGLAMDGSPYGGVGLFGQDVIGACVEGTRVTSSAASEVRALFSLDQGSTVRNVGIEAPLRRAFAIYGPGVVEDVAIEGAANQGIYVV